MHSFREEYEREFDLIFSTFRKNGYEHVWPGVTADNEQQARELLEPVFYKCFNRIVTRCFGWGLPHTCMVPFADCINHHNVDSNYEYICEQLHAPLMRIEEKLAE